MPMDSPLTRRGCCGCNGRLLGYPESSEVVTGVGQRRQNHKTAEQKRRDIQKTAFDAVRSLLPNTDSSANKIDILRRGSQSQS